MEASVVNIGQPQAVQEGKPTQKSIYELVEDALKKEENQNKSVRQVCLELGVEPTSYYGAKSYHKNKEKAPEAEKEEKKRGRKPSVQKAATPVESAPQLKEEKKNVETEADQITVLIGKPDTIAKSLKSIFSR